jgi:hypothetical protein
MGRTWWQVADILISGVVRDVVPYGIYVDGDEVPGFRFKLEQAAVEDRAAQLKFVYYPPVIQVAEAKVVGKLVDGAKVECIVRPEAFDGKGEKAGKRYVGLRGRSVVVV